MKQFQRLFASLLLVCALALNAPAGIIQTGNPPPPPPENSSTEESGGEREAEKAEGETPVLEAATVIVRDFLYGVLAIF